MISHPTIIRIPSGSIAPLIILKEFMLPLLIVGVISIIGGAVWSEGIIARKAAR